MLASSRYPPVGPHGNWDYLNYSPVAHVVTKQAVERIVNRSVCGLFGCFLCFFEQRITINLRYLHLLLSSSPSHRQRVDPLVFAPPTAWSAGSLPEAHCFQDQRPPGLLPPQQHHRAHAAVSSVTTAL